MCKYCIIILLLGFVSSCFGGDPKFSASTIPEELKAGMYAVIRESDSRFYIESKNRSSQHFRRVITILNAKAKQYASITIGYDKLTKIESFKANVYDAEGNSIKKLKQGDLVDQSSVSGYSLYEDDRVKHADLAQNTYPYTVEVEYVLSMQFLYSIPDFHLYRDDEVSALETTYSIIYPKELKPRYRLFNIAEPKISIEPDHRESLTWKFENIIPNKFEKYGPDVDKVVPNIKAAPSDFEYSGYTGSMDTWEDFGKWISLLNKGRDVLPESTKLKAQELTANLKTTEEKAKVLYQYLQNKTRYVSIQLGIGGYQPFEASVVDETGYGDCKALSNYMISILQAVGVKSHYVLISAGENAMPLQVDFSDSQFNHAIVAIPNGADTLWLECTSQTKPFSYMGTFTGDRKALLITNNGAEVVNTTRYSAEQNSQIRTADVFVLTNGDATANVKTTYSGLQYENGDLDFYINNKYDDQKKWLQENTAIPSFDIAKFNMTDKKDKIPSAIVSVEFILKRFASVSGKRIFLTPNLMNRSTFIPENLSSRKTNVVKRMAYTDIDTIRYHLPEGIYPEYLPDPIKVKSRFGEYEASFRLGEGTIIFIRKLKMNKGEFPPESYTELVEFYRSLNKADNTKMVFLSKT